MIGFDTNALVRMFVEDDEVQIQVVQKRRFWTEFFARFFDPASNKENSKFQINHNPERRYLARCPSKSQIPNETQLQPADL